MGDVVNIDLRGAYKAGVPQKRLSGEQRRRQILAAALTAFAQHGYHRASIDRLSAAAGVTPPLLYDHFPSKQALYIAVLEQQAAAMFARIAEHLDPATEHLEERLAAVAGGLLTYVREQPAGWQLLSAEPAGEPEIACAYARLRVGTIEVASRVTASDPAFTPPAGFDRGRGADIFGHLQWAAYESLVGWAAAHPDVPVDVLVGAFMDFIWVGLERFRTGRRWKRKL